MEWQPISTAPRDGTQIIVPSEWAGMDADIAQFDALMGGWWSVKIDMPIEEPTYWMPIPPIPVEQKPASGA